ncbi:hypothetical protein [Streptomyces sp. NPDC096033]|uniref:hypothetical protein n=1 Tax=Streptomyces sp. NPDC096033 TaxID=3366071 RepID=UPI00381CE18E
MSAAEAGAATVAVICVAVYAAYRILCWLLGRHIRARRAERAEAAADKAARRQQEIAQLEAWLQLHPHRKNTIPHQTRRTEEDQ